ncbi:MAG: hypothetical protein AB8H79_19225 [Myxococcota bacterium]
MPLAMTVGATIHIPNGFRPMTTVRRLYGFTFRHELVHALLNAEPCLSWVVEEALAVHVEGHGTCGATLTAIQGPVGNGVSKHAFEDVGSLWFKAAAAKDGLPALVRCTQNPACDVWSASRAPAFLGEFIERYGGPDFFALDADLCAMTM